VQFSPPAWRGLKEETAKQIEQNLTDKNSPYYLGPNYEHLLDFQTADPDTERFNRLTDDKNHYYFLSLHRALFERSGNAVAKSRL